MYRGINAIALDAKGRVTIPTRYRSPLQEACAGKMVVTIDTEEPCLLLYPLTEWEVIEEKITALSSFNRVTRRIQRLLVGHATEVEIDNNGRLLLPPPLRQYANLDKNIVLVGQGKKFEVWEEQRWNEARGEWLDVGLDDEEKLPDELRNLSL